MINLGDYFYGPMFVECINLWTKNIAYKIYKFFKPTKFLKQSILLLHS